MNKQDIEDKLRAIIVDRIGVDPSEVGTDTNLINDLGCDSLDIVEIVMDVEREFNIQIPNEDLSHFEAFSKAVKYLELHILD